MSGERYLRVWDDDGSYCVTEECESSLDAAVSLYLAEGRDSLIQITWVGGDTFKVRASLMKCWTLSTPEGRRRETEIEAERKQERDENRQAAGLPSWEDSK